jgi:hypothetical protein
MQGGNEERMAFLSVIVNKLDTILYQELETYNTKSMH